MASKREIWSEFEQIGSGKNARAKCRHCGAEKNKNISTLHNHLTSSHPSIGIKYEHTGKKRKFQVEQRAIWAEFQLAKSSRNSSKYIAKCNHCSTEVDTSISSLTSHLAQKHKTIYNKYDSYGNRASRISIRAPNYRSSRSTYTRSHYYFSSFRHYNYNDKIHTFFKTLYNLAKKS